MKKFYLTSAIPYVNAKPHIGHALEFVQTDVISRYYKSLGFEVKTLCGGDENALKNVQAAETAGIPVQKFVDENNQFFITLNKVLNVHYDIWQKGSDKIHHFPSSQKLWRFCLKNGDIYPKKYEGLYCVGCETFYAKDELNEEGECEEHPGKKLEKVVEENYFFKLKKYQEQIKNLIASNQLEITPEFRRKEVLSFLSGPLHDISISRTNKRARNWGVPVPNDPKQRIYVWFDALNIYQSGIGFGWDEAEYNKWWPADLHVIGKGIIRFHAVYWIAFLISAGLKLPKKIFVHGYLTIEGQKMSKTLGNVVDPFKLVEKYGTDPVRYYLLREIPSYNDGDFSERRFIELYNSDLANELGNLVSRITQLAINNKFDIKRIKTDIVQKKRPSYILSELQVFLDNFQFDKALEHIWGNIKTLNKYIDRERPWKKTVSEATKILSDIVIGTESIRALDDITIALSVFLPDTAKKIEDHFLGKKQITKPLFPRIK